jgi:hypothetical protein
MAKKIINILIASPISDYKDYVLDDWIRYVKSVLKSYSTGHVQVKLLLVDNSQDQSYHLKIERRHDVSVIHTEPTFKNSRQFICDSRLIARNVFLGSKYDFFLSLECDVFPPANFITHLLARRKHIVSLPYFIGDGIQSRPMIQVTDKSPAEPRTTRDLSAEELFMLSGSIFPVFNAGLGCTLISRRIIEQFAFRWDKEIDFHDDSFLADDLYQNHITWWCDASLICRHDNVPWNYFPKNKF